MLKLLIIKTSSLGDVVHNLPIIADIKLHFPDAEIDWVVEESFADIPKLHPHIRQVIPVAIRRWRKNLFSMQTWQQLKAIKKQIATERYDIVLDTQGLIKSGLIATWAHGVRHGYNKNSCREPLASYFYQAKHDASRAQHAVNRNRALTAAALGYATPTTSPNYGIQATQTKHMDLPQRYVIGLHGTSRESKLWPIEHWVALGNWLITHDLELLLPWASEAEFARASIIATSLNNATVLPKQSISQLADIISHAHATVGVDTGLSHLSTAVDTPTIAIYTDTNPALTGVMAGHNTKAINLGGVGQIPRVDEVTSAFEHLCLHSQPAKNDN